MSFVPLFFQIVLFTLVCHCLAVISPLSATSPPSIFNATWSAGLSYSCGGQLKYSLGVSHQSDWVITPDGRNRSFNVYIPTGYSNSKQSLHGFTLLLHGGLSNKDTAETQYGMDISTDHYGFVLFYGDGISGTWNTGGGCCGAANNQHVDDVTFLGLLIEYAMYTLCIDPSIITVSGLSNGAVMSHTMGCARPDIITAIAPVEGTLLNTPCSNPNPLNPIRMNVLQVWGTLDANFYWNGGLSPCGVSGVSWKSHPFSMNTWINFNGGCQCIFPDIGGPPPLSYGSNRCPSQSFLAVPTTSTTKGNWTSYGSCVNNANVTLLVVIGGGHSWQGAGTGGAPIAGCSFANTDFKLNDVIFQFFIDNKRIPSGGAFKGINVITALVGGFLALIAQICLGGKIVHGL